MSLYNFQHFKIINNMMLEMTEKAKEEHNHEGLRSSKGYNIVHFRDLYNFILVIINLAKNEVKRQHLF